MSKIFFFVKSMYGGGAQRVIINLSNVFLKKFEIHIITLDNKNDFLLSPNIYLHSVFLKNYLPSVSEISALLKELQISKEDLLIVCSSSAPLYKIANGIIDMLSFKVSYLVALTNEPTMSPEDGKLRELRDSAFADAFNHGAHFIFQTESAKNYFPREIQLASIIANNPISSSLPKPYYGPREKRFVSLGRLVKQKNYPLLINAFKRFNKSFPNYCLDIFGNGPEYSHLLSLIGSDDRIKIHNFDENAFRYVRKATAFILSSDFEGVSNAMIEALCMGVPTIVTDCPAFGGRMFIKNGVNGLLVPVGDEDSLENAMLDVASNKRMQKRFTRRNFYIRKLFNAKKISKQYLTLAKVGTKK